MCGRPALHKARQDTGNPLVLTKIHPTLRHLLRLTNLEQGFTLAD
jgi:anti-anti-sigma regulatory factor